MKVKIIKRVLCPVGVEQDRTSIGSFSTVKEARIRIKKMMLGIKLMRNERITIIDNNSFSTIMEDGYKLIFSLDKVMKKNKSYSKAHKILKRYLNDKNLTALCRDLKKMGVVDRTAMIHLFYDHYTPRYMHRMDFHPYLLLSMLKTDLNEKEPYNDRWYPETLKQNLDRRRKAGAYTKVLIEGNRHIYWADPVFKHKDYNKSIWRDNTPRNRERMRIINNYLNR